MNSSILITKSRIPQLPPDWTARPRLSARISEALRRKFLLISAPAGYGKTTAIIETLKGLNKPAGWISLDSNDNSPASFWTYTVTALQSILPDVCTPILNALQSPQLPPSEWIRNTLINSFSSHEGFALVLDDYHVIETPEIHESMSFLIEHLPPQVNFVIASRIDPPFPLARWRAQGIMAEVRAADLSFSREEAAIFLEKINGIILSTEDLNTLETRTEGWAAGLKMAALSLAGKPDITGYIKAFSGSNRYILDYLAEEVLNQQSEETRRFLRETSILDRLCGPLCDAVTGRDDSQSLLEQLEAANLFISPLDDERRWYRYHQLFATILRNQLAKDPVEIQNALHHRASVWYEEEGLIPEAVNHALADNDSKRAADLLETAAPAMLGRNQSVTLLDYVPHISEEIIMASPWLCVCFAWAALTANKPEILGKMLSGAVRGLEEGRNTSTQQNPAVLPRIQGHILSIQSFIAQARNDMASAIKLAEEANRILPQNDIDDLLARAVNSLSMSAYYRQTGDISKSVPLHEELIAAGRKANYYYAILSSLGGLAEVEMELGHFDRAAERCREAIAAGTRWGGSYPLPTTAYAYYVMGVLNYEQNDMEAAADNLIRGIELGESSFTLEPALKGCLHMAKVLQAQGHPGKADEFIRRAENTGPWVVVPPEVQQISAWKARLALKRANISAAIDWATREAQLFLDKVPAYQQEFDYLTLARIKLQTGEYQQLPEYLSKLIENAERQKRIYTVIEALILKAIALDSSGATTAAIDTIKRALALAEPAGYIRIFIDEGEPIAEILRRAAGMVEFAEYINKLVKLMETSPQSSISYPAGMVETLSEREIEVLRLIAAGNTNKEIAARLYLAVGTVKKHTNNVFGKLGVTSRTQAVARARELGLLQNN